MLKKEIARRFDVSPSALRNLATGIQKPGIYTQHRIAALMDLDLAEVKKLTPKQIEGIINQLFDPNQALKNQMLRYERGRRSIVQQLDKIGREMKAGYHRYETNGEGR